MKNQTRCESTAHLLQGLVFHSGYIEVRRPPMYDSYNKSRTERMYARVRRIKLPSIITANKESPLKRPRLSDDPQRQKNSKRTPKTVSMLVADISVENTEPSRKELPVVVRRTYTTKMKHMVQRILKVFQSSELVVELAVRVIKTDHL